MMSGNRNRFPFTASQWQELEHQALIFKYMISGIPIPPDLLFTIKRSCLALDPPPLSSKLFSRQSPHVGWSCFQMGLGRKIDPEPGRCRRTDGKKWRCSKEAYLDSKYCERHMHRGKNRSRKPVELIPTTTTSAAATLTPTPTPPTPTISSITKNPSTITQSSHSLSETHHHHNHTQSSHSLLHYPGYNTNPNHPFLYSHTSSARPTGIGLSREENNTHLVLDSGSSYSHTNTDYRYVYGLKEEVDEHAFFSEPSGTMRSFSGSSMDDSWQLTPLTMSSSSSSKQRSCSGLQNDYSYLQLQSLTDQHKQDQHCYILGSDIKCEMPIKLERQEEEQEPQKIVHRFFDEWPPKNRESWLDLDDKSSNNSTSVSTTRLSISIPSSSHDFPIFNSRAHNDG